MNYICSFERQERLDRFSDKYENKLGKVAFLCFTLMVHSYLTFIDSTMALWTFFDPSGWIRNVHPFNAQRGMHLAQWAKTYWFHIIRKVHIKRPIFPNFHILAIHRKVSTAPPLLQSVVIFYKTSHSASLSFQINGTLFKNFTDLLNFERIFLDFMWRFTISPLFPK